MIGAGGVLAIFALFASATLVAAAPSCFSRVWEEAEHSHRDLGHGRVAWVWSWTLEGVADDIHVLDCASGKGLRIRARAERMQNPIPYDRRDRAAKIIRDAADAPHFFSFDTLARSLAEIRVPSQPLMPDAEPCACAAYYPGAFVPGHQTRTK